MADEPKTTSYNVRLIPSYDHPRGHRRAGIEFASHAAPVTVELTEEQHKAIKADPSLEILSDSDVKKINERLKLSGKQDGSAKELQDVDNISGEADDGTTPQTGREYVDDPTRADSPERDAVSDALGATVDDTPSDDSSADDSEPTPDDTIEAAGETATDSGSENSEATIDNPTDNDNAGENLDDLSRVELNARAADLGIKEPEQLPNKQEVINAIVAADNTPSDNSEE